MFGGNLILVSGHCIYSQPVIHTVCGVLYVKVLFGSRTARKFAKEQLRAVINILTDLNLCIFCNQQRFSEVKILTYPNN